MASPAHAFEMGAEEPSFPPEVSEMKSIERNAKPLEVVRPVTLVEMKDVLEAGASFAIYKSSHEEPDDETMGLTNKKMMTVYLSSSPENISKLLSSGLFSEDWKKDVFTYRPFVCLTNTRIESLKPTYDLIEEAMREPLEFVPDDGMYVLEKKQQREEEGQGRRRAA